MIPKIIIFLVAIASASSHAEAYDHWVTLKKGETVSQVIHNLVGSPYYGFYIWPKGGMVDQAFEASGLERTKDAQLPVGTKINLGFLYKYQDLEDAKIVGSESEDKNVEIAEAPPPKPLLGDKHKLKIGLYSLHTELAAEQTLSQGSGTSADEILSQVRASASLDYRYQLAKRLQLHALLYVRWYEYSESLLRNVRKDQSNIAFRPHLGVIYKASERLKLGVNLFRDEQLFYYGDEVNPELFFELDVTIGLGGGAQVHALSFEHFDVDPYIYGDYFTAPGDNVGSGYSLGGGVEIPFLKRKKFALDLRYERKYFDFFSSDITHEILEFGLSYNL
jgi:hypothetical protein